jgi:GAF domain-containing protein
VALVSFTDDHRQWFKSAIGTTATQVPREIAFCTHAVTSGKPLVVLDAQGDQRFANNPMVVGKPGIRFNVSVPVRAANGAVMGLVCIVDTSLRKKFAERKLELLNDLAEVVGAELALQQAVREKKAALTYSAKAHSCLAEALFQSAMHYDPVANLEIEVVRPFTISMHCSMLQRRDRNLGRHCLRCSADR